MAVCVGLLCLSQPKGRLSTLSWGCPSLISMCVFCHPFQTLYHLPIMLIGNRHSSHAPSGTVATPTSRSPTSSLGDTIQLCFMIFFFRARRPPPSAPARPFF